MSSNEFNDDDSQHSGGSSGRNNDNGTGIIDHFSASQTTYNSGSDMRPGHVETMKEEIDRLKGEVASGKKKLKAQKKKYEEEIAAVKEDTRIKLSERYISEENRQREKLLNTLQKRVQALEFGPSFEIRTAVLKLCKKHEIIINVDTEEEMNDNLFLQTIKIISKYIKKAKLMSDGGGVNASTGNDTDSDLQSRVKALEAELRLALGAANDIKALKAKLMQMVDRIRIEKDTKLKIEADMVSTKKTVEMLTDHIEKLMIHLKHEAASKVRAMEQLRMTEKEVVAVKDKCELVARKAASKDRLIVELREGSKVLEDQLRLMDEKYLEMRSKLDWARENGERRVNKAERQASELRMKFALSNTGVKKSLDSLPLPDIFTGMLWDPNTGEPVPESILLGSQTLQSQRSISTAKSGKSSKKGLSERSASQGNLMASSQEFSMDHITEKLRVQQGGSRTWTEEKIKSLVAPS